MNDPVSAAIAAIVHGRLAGLPIAAVAGLLTSFGPCMAPRYLALAPLLQRRGRAATIALFVCGMLVTYLAISFGVGVAVDVTRAASIVYVIFSAALLVLGTRMLLRGDTCADRAHGCAQAHPSGAFSLGAASALNVSPCCTPVLLAVSAVTAADGDVASRLLLLAAFVAGHAGPLFVAVPLARVFERAAAGWRLGAAPAVVASALTIALGAYYGLLV
jgi:cytochrome c biogenesis protein CcdA